MALVFTTGIAVGVLPAQAHGGAVEVVVETLVRSGEELGVVDVGIALVFADGDAVAGAEVALSVEPGESVEFQDVVETTPGVYVGRVRFPGSGQWRVTVAFDGPDSSGSVEFTQVIEPSGPSGPLVMVDTVDPGRAGRPVDADSSIVAGASGPAAVGEHRFPIVVEAFVGSAETPLVIDYAVALEAAEASIVFEAESSRGDRVAPVELIPGDGVHRTTIIYPRAAAWTVTLQVDTVGGAETVAFEENLPWPHFTTEAGRPKVKYDSGRPERTGTIADPQASVYLQQAVEQPPTPATVTARENSVTPASETPANEVVVDIAEPADELRIDIGLRVIHLASLGLWVIPLIASALGREQRHSVVLVLAGMVLTAVTGGALALWGAPVGFPGVLRWEELAGRAYGDAYLVTFLAKMAVVALAMVATIVWASRRSRRAVAVTLGGLGAALIAVTVMSQLHVFSHL